jgi:hypothetical protein
MSVSRINKLIFPLILLVMGGILIIGCKPKVVGLDETPAAATTASASDAQPTAAAPVAADAKASTTADQNASIVEYLTNLPVATPDFASKQDSHPVGKMNPPDSLKGSGAFPDNYFTSNILHTGARGCSACHADLYSLIKNLSPDLHVASHPTYGKQDDILDCKTCHDVATSLTGPKLADIIHSAHENNELFTDAYKGNCWSCHAVNTKNEMVLWETVKYDAALAGFLGATNDDVTTWQKARGFENGNMVGFNLVSDLGLEIVDEK